MNGWIPLCILITPKALRSHTTWSSLSLNLSLSLKSGDCVLWRTFIKHNYLLPLPSSPPNLTLPYLTLPYLRGKLSICKVTPWLGLPLGASICSKAAPTKGVTFSPASLASYPSTVANSTLLFSEFVEIFNFYFLPNQKNILWRDNSENLGIFHLLKMNFWKWIN